jgi:hypothetical protein
MKNRVMEYWAGRPLLHYSSTTLADPRTRVRVVYWVPKGNESSFRPSWRFSFSLWLIRLWRKREPESRKLIQTWIP